VRRRRVVAGRGRCRFWWLSFAIALVSVDVAS
jgi:hypothetical protein